MQQQAILLQEQSILRTSKRTARSGHVEACNKLVLQVMLREQHTKRLIILHVWSV